MVKVMIRKIIVRTFFVSAAVMCLVVASGLLAGYLAFQQPGFYATLRSQNVDLESENELKQQASDLQQWVRNSLTTQRMQGVNDAEAYDPANDTHTIQLSERHLNAFLVSRDTGAGGMQHPRICLEQDSVRLGAEFDFDNTKLVFSAAVKPVVAANGRLHFEVQSGHVGRLRIPLNTLLSLMDSNVKQLSNGVELQINGGNPTFILNPRFGPNAPKIQSIDCQNGQLAVTFQAPISPEAGHSNRDRVSKSERQTTL